jgi:integrase/recombinase XerD
LTSIDYHQNHASNRTKISTRTRTINKTISPILDRKIDDVCAGLQNSYANGLRSLSIENNIVTIVNYIYAMKIEINLSLNYRRGLIKFLSGFSNYVNKDFKDVARDDVISFLESLRKTETIDPLHKWIGTYNLFRIHLIRFLKWYYSPDLEPGKRSKPSVIDNIPKLKRKEISIYKPSDMWTADDDLLFLKYCPSKRDCCYHAISRDTSARPHEILNLKIKDVVFKTTGRNQYAEAVVNGKTGTRPIPLINSIPFLKDYLNHEHPQSSNPNAPLICGIGTKLGRHITIMAINRIYWLYKNKIFPKLLESPNVVPEDKQKIRDLLRKPWNPYVRRHSALTEKSTILKEHVLRQHSGWKPGSQMHLKYLHYFGNESNESLLEAYGLVDKGIQIDQLKPKQCPNCNEPNKVDSRFCAKCKIVLSYDAWQEVQEEQKKKESEVQSLKEKYELDMKSIREDMDKQFTRVMELIRENPKLARVKPEALVKKNNSKANI